MELRITTSTTLHRPDADTGLVTWLDVKIVGDPGDDDDGLADLVGRIRAAIIHVGVAGGELYDALDADSGELEALYDVFFEDNWFKEEFFHAAGHDMLYVSEVVREPGWKDRNADLAAVRRLCDTLGQSCELAVIAVDDAADAKRWTRMGFKPSPTPEEWGLHHMQFAFIQPSWKTSTTGTSRFCPTSTRGSAGP